MQLLAQVVTGGIEPGTAASDVTILFVTIGPNEFTRVKVGRKGAHLLRPG